MPDMRLWPTGRLLSTAARLLEHAWNEKLNDIGLNYAGLITLDVLAASGPRQHNQAGHRLNKTVAAAKSVGASWADIGRAVGISRQSAHERWSYKK